MTAPPLAVRQQPGLSETLAGPRSPIQCQSCGTPSRELLRWQECDAWDQKTHTIVMLCARCSAQHIDANHRLYHLVDRHEPCAGAMLLCVGCAFNSGTRCLHADAKQNGGAGLAMTYPKPVGMFITCSPRSRSGFRRMYPGPVTACAGRADIAEDYG